VEPLKPLLRRRHTGTCYAHNHRLTVWDVGQIRKWAVGPGFGLNLAEQVRELQAMATYATLGSATLHDVLTNASWFDPKYDRTAPSALPPTASPTMITWFLFFLLMLRTAERLAPEPVKTVISQ
jgi:hypothetical protein